jgi:hypothetical protein
MGLRRAYHRWVGPTGRFRIAVAVTIVVVAYVVVPPVARLVSLMGGYEPQVYEPKDFARQSWLQARSRAIGLPPVSVDTVVNLALVLLVALVWLALGPPGGARS